MTLLVALLLAQTPELAIRPRTPIAIQLSTPSSDPTRTSPRELLDTALALIERETDLAPVVMRAEEVADCAGGLACLSHRARARAEVELVLVLSAIARRDANDLVSALLVDGDAVLECEKQQPDAIDLCASDRAILAELERTEIEDIVSFERALSDMLSRGVRDHWRSTGQVDLSLAVEGATVLVDGASVGELAGRTARLTLVPLGRRSIGAQVRGERAEEEIEVSRDRDATVTLDHPKWHSNPLPREALLWTGVGTAVAGVAISLWAIVFSATAERGYTCGPECPTDFVTLEELVRDRADGRGALLALPLGYSLAGAGAAWSIGAWLGEAEIPWLEAVIGLGIGVVAYSISAIMDAAI